MVIFVHFSGRQIEGKSYARKIFQICKARTFKQKKQSDIINACLQSYNLVKIVLMSRVYKK